MKHYDLIVVFSPHGGRACAMRKGIYEEIVFDAGGVFDNSKYKTYANSTTAYRISIYELEHPAVVRFIAKNKLEEVN